MMLTCEAEFTYALSSSKHKADDQRYVKIGGDPQCSSWIANNIRFYRANRQCLIVGPHGAKRRSGHAIRKTGGDLSAIALRNVLQNSDEPACG